MSEPKLELTDFAEQQPQLIKNDSTDSTVSTLSSMSDGSVKCSLKGREQKLPIVPPINQDVSEVDTGTLGQLKPLAVSFTDKTATIQNGFGLTQYKIVEKKSVTETTKDDTVTETSNERSLEVNTDISKINIDELIKLLQQNVIRQQNVETPKDLILETQNPKPQDISNVSLEPYSNVSLEPYSEGLEYYTEKRTTFQQITFTPPVRAGASVVAKPVTLLFPYSPLIKPVLMPQNPEEFAQSYVQMLIVKEEQILEAEFMDWQNKISQIVFKCTMSLLLGYLYNYFKYHLLHFATTTPLGELEADEIGMMIIQSEIDDGVYQDDDYSRQFERLTFIKSLLMKEGVASAELKSLLNIPALPMIVSPDGLGPNPEQQEANQIVNYETILEMVCRVGTQLPADHEGKPGWSYAKMLHSVCSNICNILVSYGIFSEAVWTKAMPIADAVLTLIDTSDSTTIFGRMKAVIVLGVAYNSYGWLFALVAPFAIPAAIGVTNWAICFLARLPFKAIGFVAKGAFGVGKWLIDDKTGIPPFVAPPSSDGSLICVGHTRTAGENGVLVPYMVSMNDINHLSHELMHYKEPSPSLATWLFDARGVADLMMQSNEPGKLNISLFKETHPIATLLKCIDVEITELTNTSKVGELKTIEEIIFSVFFNTICRDKEAKNGFLIGPVIRMWGDVIHEAISGVRSGVLGTVKGVITELILNDLDVVIETDSLPGSSYESGNSSRQSSVESNGSMCSIDSFKSFGSFNSFNSDNSSFSFDSNKSSCSFSNVSIISTKEQIQIDLTNKTEQINFRRKLRPSVNVEKQDETMFGKTMVGKTMFDEPKDLPANAEKQGIESNVVNPDSASVIAENKYGVSRIVISNLETTKYRIHSETLQKDNVEAEKLADQIIAQMKAPQSDLLILSVLDWVTNKSLYYLPPTSTPPSDVEGGYRRRRNVPILAEIKQKIVKTAGLFNAIKPKLVRVKGRKSKRYGPKKGTKKWRKRYGSRRGTKKVYRKRHNTHKKRK